VTGYDGSPPTAEEQHLQVRIAVGYAAEGNAWAMLAHLQRANVLAGVKIAFRRKWADLPDEEIDDILGRGVDALFQKVNRGDQVENPVGYLLQVMHHEAHDYTARQEKIVPLDAWREEAHPSGAQSTSPDRSAALRLARDILPRLGQHNVQTVMAYIFDAVEAGRSNVTSTEIASATCLTEDSVRQCRSRGFRRLERIAQEDQVRPKAADDQPDSHDSRAQNNGTQAV
jgi:DNA-directed RNA polymerase specialized sigma24 family protein